MPSDNLPGFEWLPGYAIAEVCGRRNLNMSCGCLMQPSDPSVRTDLEGDAQKSCSEDKCEFSTLPPWRRAQIRRFGARGTGKELSL